MDDHNLRLPHPCIFCKGGHYESVPRGILVSADGVEDHVPRTLALGSIVPILDQERQGWGSPFRGDARVGQPPGAAIGDMESAVEAIVAIGH